VDEEKTDEDIRDTIRFMGNLMKRSKLRVHKDCVNTIRQLQSYQWSPDKSEAGKDVPLEAGSECCVALRQLIKTKVSVWRLSA
jgi:hypothetical protein